MLGVSARVGSLLHIKIMCVKHMVEKIRFYCKKIYTVKSFVTFRKSYMIEFTILCLK